jgi:hypothetical protein
VVAKEDLALASASRSYFAGTAPPPREVALLFEKLFYLVRNLNNFLYLFPFFIPFSFELFLFF